MKSLISSIQWINEYAGRAVAWITSGLVLLICYDVAMRYIFRYTKIWIVELEWHLFALIFLLSMGYTFLHDRHVRVDVFYANYSPKGKAWVNFIGGLIFLLPLCVAVLISSFDFAMRAFVWNESSADPGGLPYRWIIKGSMFVGFVLLTLQAIAGMANNLLVISGQSPALSPSAQTEEA